MKKPSFERLCPAQAYTILVVLFKFLEEYFVSMEMGRRQKPNKKLFNVTNHFANEIPSKCVKNNQRGDL